MVMVPKFSNFHDESSENDELREYELSGFDCILLWIIDSKTPENKLYVRVIKNSRSVHTTLKMRSYHMYMVK